MYVSNIPSSNGMKPSSATVTPKLKLPMVKRLKIIFDDSLHLLFID